MYCRRRRANSPSGGIEVKYLHFYNIYVLRFFACYRLQYLFQHLHFYRLQNLFIFTFQLIFFNEVRFFVIFNNFYEWISYAHSKYKV